MPIPRGDCRAWPLPREPAGPPAPPASPLAHPRSLLSRRSRRIAVWLAAPILLLSGLFGLGVLWPLPEAAPVVSRRPIALVGATLVDLERGIPVPGRTVLVADGRIAAVGPDGALNLPSSALRIDARGRFLVPALWDMHAHLYAVSPLLDLPLYIAYGVTHVRDMQGCPSSRDPFIACATEKRRWSREAEAGRRVGPRVVSTTSFMADGPGMLERLSSVPRHFGTATPAEARTFVRRQAARGVDAIKVYDRLPRAAYFPLVEEARRLGLDVVGHRPYEVSAVEAAAAGQKSFEHARLFLHESFAGSESLRVAAAAGAWREDRRRMVDEHDPEMARALFAAMAQHGTWYVPTHLTRWVDAYADHPAVREDTLLRYLHPLLKRQWLEDLDATVAEDPSPEGRTAFRDFHRKGLELTGAAHRAGVKILTGTDFIVAGADVHRELELLVAAGLAPLDALRTATQNPAEYMGMERRYGLAPGNVADLIVLDADPLHDIRNTRRIHAVLFNGNLYDRAALDGLQAVVRERARSWSVGCKILWRFLKRPVSY